MIRDKTWSEATSDWANSADLSWAYYISGFDITVLEQENDAQNDAQEDYNKREEEIDHCAALFGDAIKQAYGPLTTREDILAAYNQLRRDVAGHRIPRTFNSAYFLIKYLIHGVPWLEIHQKDLLRIAFARLCDEMLGQDEWGSEDYEDDEGDA